MNATLKARVLATIITENKKTPTIKSDVRNIFQEFSIENTMKYFVTDNAIAMKSAFSNEKWFSCNSHDLNLVQSHSFNDSINKNNN
jgi:indole-3-glycerol phosphate synthase